MSVEISVTAEDIRLGQRAGAGNCALDRAMRRTFKSKDAYWAISEGKGAKGDFYRPVKVHLKKVEDFIEKHDAREKVKPFKFRVVKESE